MTGTRETRWSLGRDAIDLVVLAVVSWLVHAPKIFHGMPFGDPGWYFHFGRRALHGAVPYRDFIFQVGPIPIWVDALFQRVFGESYHASLLAGFSVKTLRLALTYLIARRVTRSRVLAAAIVTFLSFERIWYSFINHWSVAYTQLSLLAATFFLILAHQNERRRSLYLPLAGGSLALMFGARQSNAMLAAFVFFGATVALALRGTSWFNRSSLARFWGGYGAGLLLLGGALGAQGALGPAIQQMLLDAPQKKNVAGTEALFDMLSGGWATQAKYDTTLTFKSSFFRYQAAPLFASIVLLVALSRPRVSRFSIALGVLPFGYLVGGITSFWSFDAYHDFPRTLATLASAWLLVNPSRLARAFGVGEVVLAPLLTLPLAMEWAMELSFPGRGWSEIASLMTAFLVIFGASTHITYPFKLACLGLLAFAQVDLYRDWSAQGLNPFIKFDYYEGTIAEQHVQPDVRALDGVRINEGRAKFIAWIRSHIAPGESCFIYGSMPALYDVAECHNPSNLDTTAADFFTEADGTRVIARLKSTPPKWIIAQVSHWMNPDLEMPFNGNDGIYSGLNPRASKVMHLGLRDLLPNYELLEPSKSIFDAAQLELVTKAPDHLERVRLYRRRDVVSLPNPVTE